VLCCCGRRTAFKALFATSKHKPLQAAATGDEHQVLTDKGPVVLMSGGIEQMYAGEVALSPAGGCQPAHAADGEELGVNSLSLKLTQEVIQSQAMTTDYNQVGESHCLTQEVNLYHRIGLHILLLAGNDHKTIRPARIGLP